MLSLQFGGRSRKLRHDSNSHEAASDSNSHEAASIGIEAASRLLCQGLALERLPWSFLSSAITRALINSFNHILVILNLLMVFDRMSAILNWLCSAAGQPGGLRSRH